MCSKYNKPGYWCYYNNIGEVQVTLWLLAANAQTAREADTISAVSPANRVPDSSSNRSAENVQVIDVLLPW